MLGLSTGIANLATNLAKMQAVGTQPDVNRMQSSHRQTSNTSSGERTGSPVVRKRPPTSVPSNPPQLELHYITSQMCCVPHPKMEGKAIAISNFLSENHPHKYMFWNLSDDVTAQSVYTEFSNQVWQETIYYYPVWSAFSFPFLNLYSSLPPNSGRLLVCVFPIELFRIFIPSHARPVVGRFWIARGTLGS